MRKRLWHTAPLSLIGTALLAAVFAVTASGGSSSRAVTKTLQLAVGASDVDYSDPALAYGALSWQIEFETCAMLINYSDVNGPVNGNAGTELTPDTAAGMPAISRDGKTYTFTVRPGVKFNDGTPVTAQSFKAAFDRDANPQMNSPVTAFVTDIVGWNAVINKRATSVSGVIAKGNKLTIHLTEKDGGMLDKLAMPFFCAIEPSKTPVDPAGVTTLPGAGPYYIASRTVGKQLVLQRNPNYKGLRPHRSDTIVITMDTNPQQTYLQVSNGTYAADPSALDNPSAAAQLAKQYGINKGRFFVHALPETDYVALNSSRPTFANAAVRRAVNYAIDRPALLRVRGFEGGKRTSAILPPSLAGGVNDPRLYPIKGADPGKAKQVDGGKCGNVTLWYQTGPVGTPQSGILSYNLQQMGCNVTLRPFQGYAIYNAAGVKGADYDAVIVGWYQDYADGYDFFHILLDGRTIHASSNNNLSYFNSPDINKQIDAANALTGTARTKAWGKLDAFTMSHLAPWAPIDNRNLRDFVGPRTAGYLFLPSLGTMDIGTLYIK
jgi:peptide/nickel transport system substrate-binding protein